MARSLFNRGSKIWAVRGCSSLVLGALVASACGGDGTNNPKGNGGEDSGAGSGADAAGSGGKGSGGTMVTAGSGGVAEAGAGGVPDVSSAGHSGEVGVEPV